MKAIFVESANGYLARNELDDMSWTPSLDKKIFKFLTLVSGGICVCSKHTYKLLPNIMLKDTNRKYIIAERTGEKSLSELNKKYPNAVLVGGVTFLKAAYDLDVIDTFVVTTVPLAIQSTEKYKNPFTKILKTPACMLLLDTMSVKVYIKQKER